MHFVEQTGQPLYLVHEHPSAGGDCLQLAGESSHVRQIALIQGLVEQVDAMRIGVFVAHPGRLAGAARTEQKEGRARRRQCAGAVGRHGLLSARQCEKNVMAVVILRRFMTT